MKVVYNPQGFGLHLTEDEMLMFCKACGYTLLPTPRKTAALSSDDTWFTGVYWEDFRTNGLLVQMVEQGRLDNKHLVVREVEGAWCVDTDFRTYERIEKVC